MINLKLLPFILFNASAFAGDAPAKSEEIGQISYNNFSLSYLQGNADASIYTVAGVYSIYGSGTLESNGIQLGFELPLGIPGEKPLDNFYLALNGSWSSANLSGELNVDGLYSLNADVSFDYFTLNLGSGYYIPITNSIHFVTEVGVDYNRADLTIYSTDLSSDDIGFYAMPHIRAKNGRVEFHTGFKLTTNLLAQSPQSYFARVIYEVNPKFDLFASGYLGLKDSEDTVDYDAQYGFQAGIRLKF